MSRYASAAAFKQAVENRLRSASSSGANFARKRQRLVFDRLLARLTREFGDSAMLKGGLVVELRVERHAYTLPRKRPNSRVKDLPDIALLAGVREIEAGRLKGALEQTFTSRKTHPLPIALPPPAARLGGTV